MSESVSVAVRFRPLSPSELQEDHVRQQALKVLKSGNPEVWTITTAQNLVINNRTNLQYQFGIPYSDTVFDQSAANSLVFEVAAKPVVQKAVEGIHGTIFAYGQTSSGKTYTMKGTEEQPGVIPLALAELFRAIRDEEERVFLVKVAYLEVYNETVNDLLDSANTNLEIRENLERGTFVQNLTERPVSSESEALELLYHGESNRKVGETSMNEQSSRSHTIFKVHVESTPVENADIAPVRLSYLNLVDLAGSEGVQKTKAEDLRQREGSNINKSLLSLSNVIQKLSEAQGKGIRGYINFRDSKMTRLLQTSLSGNSKTVIICNVTQSVRHMTETTNTLNFGQNAKRIKLSARPNEVMSTESQLRQSQEDIRRLRVSLEVSEEQVHAKETELLRMRQMDCEKDQYYQELQEKLETENEELRRQVRKVQGQLEQAAKGIVDSGGKTSLLCTPQSTGKSRSTLSPESSIHTLESLLLEKDRKIQILEQNLAHISVTYEEKYQSLLMDNECLRGINELPNVQSSQESRPVYDSPKDFELSEKFAELASKLDEQVREREEIEEIAKDYEKQLAVLKQQLSESSGKDVEIDRLRTALRAQTETTAAVQVQAQNRARDWQASTEAASRLGEELNAVVARKAQVESELSVLLSKHTALDQIAEEMTIENERLHQDYSEARSTIAELYTQVETLMAENDQQSRTLAEVFQRNQDLAKEVTYLNNELAAKQSPVLSVETDTEELDAKVRQVTALEAQLRSMTASVTETAESMRDLQETHEQLKQAAKEREGELTAEVASLQRRLDGLTGQLSPLQEELSVLRSALAGKDEEIVPLQAEVSALLSAIASKDGELQQLREEFSRVQNALSATSAELAKTQDQHADSVHSQNNASFEELTELRAQFALALEESRELKASLLEARQALRVKEAQATDLQCSLTALQNADWETRAKVYEAKLLKLEAEVRDTAISLAREHSERKQEKTKEIHDLRIALETAEGRVREVEEKLCKKEEEIDELNRRLTYKRLPSDLMDERLKDELTSKERYQLHSQLQSGVNKVKELEQYIQKQLDKVDKLKKEVEVKRVQEQASASRIRELERKVDSLEHDIAELEQRLCSRKSPCEIMPRRVDRIPIITPSKHFSQDEEEDVDLGSELKTKCTPQ